MIIPLSVPPVWSRLTSNQLPTPQYLRCSVPRPFATGFSLILFRSAWKLVRVSLTLGRHGTVRGLRPHQRASYLQAVVCRFFVYAEYICPQNLPNTNYTAPY